MMVGDMPGGAMLACLFAATLLILAIRAAAAGAPRLLRICALGGGGLLAGATLYMQSAMALAPLATIMFLGALAGAAAVGKARWNAAQVIAGLQGLAGFAIMATVAAIQWDPQAIGLADPIAQMLWSDGRLPLAIAMALGSGVGAGALAVGVRLAGVLPRIGSRWRVLAFTLLIATGVLIRQFCVTPTAGALWSAAAAAAIAGGAFALPAADDDLPVAKALLAALTGLAAALIGLLLHNPAMIAVGGAVCGGAGMLALRLRRRVAPLSNRSLSS